MSNFHQADDDPTLSTIRVDLSAVLPSSLSRRTAVRRNPLSSQWRANRDRRLQNASRESTSPVPRYPGEQSRKPPRTGANGQPEMELLRMELEYCDGGLFDCPAYPHEYSPQSALRDDFSVYCTKYTPCNMVLKHVDGQCFAVQKLVIRASSIGYTSPVSSGMVFITMDRTDLLSRTEYTARYELDLTNDDNSYDRSYDVRFLGSGSRDPQDNHPPPERVMPSLQGGLPGPSAVLLSGEPPLEATIEQSLPPPPELLQPHATFSDKDKSPGRPDFVINFNPAISGRYILVKFFAPPSQANIDIEFIGAYGWVGRRVFPSWRMR